MRTYTVDQLLKRNEDLRLRLEEAEEALRALRAGEADAVLVDAGGEQVFTLESADKPYWLLVAEMPYPAAMLTTDGTIISCNRRFADLLRQPTPSVPGQPIQDFVTPDDRPVLQALLRDGLVADAQAEVSFQRGDGAPVAIYLGVRALREGALGLCLMVTDLTEQRHYQKLQHAQEALRASEERLELAQRAGRIGTFDWNIRTGAVSWSATKEEHYGLPPGGFGGRYEDWRQAVHPDDRERAEADRRRAVAERTELDSEFRIVRPDGETRWIASKGKVFYAGDGEPLRMLGVSLDVTERKRAEEELRNADRRKDEFLAMLAHELRNPLGPLRSALQLVKHPNVDATTVSGMWDVMDRQVVNLTRLVDDLLDVARVTRGSIEMRKAVVDLAAMVRQAVNSMELIVAARAQELEVSVVPEGPLYVEADPTRMEQVFGNLLNNASKFSSERGRIWVTVELERDEGQVAADSVVVRIRDDGPGIDPEVLPHIFDLFAQADQSLARSRGGLGVGLTIVRRVVEQHGGRVEARSAGLGRGSEFLVYLPHVPHPDLRATGEAHASDMPVEREVVTRRILVVEDSPDGADTLAMLLRVNGHEVRTAVDGPTALEAVGAFQPEIILLDIGLPGMSGYEVAAQLRQLPGTASALLIALTGYGQQRDRDRSREAGFDQHLTKPVDHQALLRLLRSPARGA
jgi:PAS domain S-box-containing protein